MKAAPFDYVRVSCFEEMQEIFAVHGDDAQVIAGGQSLIPAMAMRMARPSVLLDIAGLPGLSGIEDAGAAIRIGAMTRYVELRESALLASHVPLMRDAVALIAHEAIRSRGTIGGNLAHADPASEMPAVVQALDATIDIRGPEGQRSVAAADFILGTYAVDLEPGEIIVSVTVPKAPAGRLSGIREFARRSGDYAAAGGAFVLDVGDGRIVAARLACFGICDRAVLAEKAAATLVGQELTALDPEPAVKAIVSEIEPTADLHNAPATKRHLIGVLTRRLLADMVSRSGKAHG